MSIVTLTKISQYITSTGLTYTDKNECALKQYTIDIAEMLNTTAFNNGISLTQSGIQALLETNHLTILKIVGDYNANIKLT